MIWRLCVCVLVCLCVCFVLMCVCVFSVYLCDDNLVDNYTYLVGAPPTGGAAGRAQTGDAADS